MEKHWAFKTAGKAFWLALLFFGFFVSSRESAFGQGRSHEVSLSFARLEEMDYDFKNAYDVRYQADNGFGGHITYWSQSFNYVYAPRVLIGGFQRIDLTDKWDLKLRIGVDGLFEYTRVSSKSGGSVTTGLEWSLGFLLGLDVPLYHKQNFGISGYWDSSLFPSGLNVILAVTGRKHSLGLRLSYKFPGFDTEDHRQEKAQEPSSKKKKLRPR